MDGGAGADLLWSDDDDEAKLSGQYHGADTLDGGAGQDQLVGGDDSYVIDDANDQVIEQAGEGTDKLLFAAYASAQPAGAVDGTGNDADNSLWGNSGNNTLNGRGGNDFLMGNAGDDVYAFNRGDGQDAIDNTDFLRDTANPGLIGAIDTLRFGAGIAETDVLGFQVNNDLVLKLKSTSEQVALIDYYGADTLDGSRVSDHKIDRVEFADGAVWDQAMIQTVVDRAANNQAPTVHTFLPALQAHAGAVFSYEIPADAIVDPDAWDSITYKVEMPDGSALPGWLGFDAATRTLSGTPSSGGTISVKVTAKDAGEGNDVMRDGAGTAAPRRRRITERHSTTRSNAYNFRQIERMKRAA